MPLLDVSTHYRLRSHQVRVILQMLCNFGEGESRSVHSLRWYSCTGRVLKIDARCLYALVRLFQRAGAALCRLVAP